jgi:predicted O-methyltransferase YrrM
MYSYDFAFLDADKRMYHQYYEMLLQLVCRSGQSHVLQEDKIDRGKVSDPEKNMLSPLWHISIKCLHVIKAVVLYIITS